MFCNKTSCFVSHTNRKQTKAFRHPTKPLLALYAKQVRRLSSICCGAQHDNARRQKYGFPFENSTASRVKPFVFPCENATQDKPLPAAAGALPRPFVR